MRDFLSSFSWNDYCFKNKNTSECAYAFSEVIQMGGEQYVPFMVSDSKPSLNKSCF